MATVIQSTTKYLREVRSEVKKVEWPTRKEVVFLSSVIVLASIAVALFLGGLDVLFQDILKKILLNN